MNATQATPRTYVLTNNEGQQVTVPAAVYQELAEDYDAGVWAVQVRLAGAYHCFILPDNF